MNVEKRVPKRVIIIYCIFFYAIWTIFELFIKPQINALPNEWIASVLKTGIIKNLVWTIPAIFLISKYQENVKITLREMFNTKINWLKYAPILAAFTLYILLGSYAINKSIMINPNFVTTKLVTVLFVGLTEEMVFRGWLLNATVTHNNKWIAILINAVMFLIIHFPRWIYEGSFISHFTNLGFLCVIGLSILFSVIFLKCKNIVVPIVLHMYWDLLAFIFGI